MKMKSQTPGCINEQAGFHTHWSGRKNAGLTLVLPWFLLGVCQYGFFGADTKTDDYK